MLIVPMCKNDSCEKAKECYRYMAVPIENQTYLEFQNICGISRQYKWFYSIDDREIRKEVIEECVATSKQ